MGKKTHGPYLVAAIEHNDLDKVKEILLKHIKTRTRIQEICITETQRLAANYTEVPVLLAATLPDPSIIKFLGLTQDVNINYVHKEIIKRKPKIKTALIIAVRGSLISTVEAILAMNADPNVQDHKQRTALHHAVRKADYRMAKMLLFRGAQPNITDAAGNTPLHIATIFGHLELVKLLVKHDADLFKKGTGGAIPIHMAAKEGHSAIVKLFCEFEVNVNMKVPCYDKREKAPLHVACEEGHAETVLMLLDECGADPNIRDSLGESPLHSASLREYDPMGMKSKDDYTETTKILLQYGAHIDLQNSRGETPLHLASRNEFQKSVDVLIRAGSDPLLEDNAGYKPYDLATADDTVTIQILKAAMEERERIQTDSMEIQAKGYSTSLMKASVSSRSGLNMNSMGSNEFIIGPGHSSNAIYEDGYLQPIGLRPRVQTHGSSQDLLGKSRSTSSSGSKSGFARQTKKSSSLLPNFRHKSGSKGSLHNLTRSTDSSHGSHPKHVQQVIEPSSPTGKNQGRSLPSPPTQRRINNVQPQSANRQSEVTSVWDVTPRSSVSTVKEVNSPIRKNQPAVHKSYESLPDSDDLQQDTPVNNPNQLRVRRMPLKSGSKAIPIMAAYPNAGKIPGQVPKHDTTDDDDDDSFFDDESFDTLDTLSERNAPAVPPKPAKRQIKKAKYSPEDARKIQAAVSNHSLNSWLEEQAGLLKKEGNLPHPPSTKVSSQEVDGHSTMSEISSVSKPRKGNQTPSKMKRSGSSEMLDQQKPPPLPPKPASRNQQQVQHPQTAQGQTVIKVVPSAQNRASPTSESTAYTESTQQYDRGQYQDSMNTMLTTEDSTSIVTESTAVERPLNRRVQNVREQNNNLKTFKGGSDQKSSITEEDSDNPNWEKVKVQKDKMYWEHTGSTENLYEAQKGKKQTNKKQSQPSNKIKGKVASQKPRRPTDGDSSDSLSWVSSDDDEETVLGVQQNSTLHIRGQQGNDSSPRNNKPLQPRNVGNENRVPQPRRAPEPELSKALTDELKFYKSLGDIQSASSNEIRTRMDRKFSEGDLLDSEAIDRQYMSNPKSQPNLHNTSMPLDMHGSRGRAYTESSEDYADDMSERRKVTIGRDQVIPSQAQRQTNFNQRSIRYDTDGKQPLKIVGGNADGIFIKEIEPGSDADRQGLLSGDQILKLNNSSVNGKTREEVVNLLKGIKSSVRLVVRNMTDVLDAILKTGETGDSFFIKTHFSYDASAKGELSFKEGDIFVVKDTLPTRNPGMWYAIKVNNKPGPEEAGLIPNDFKAEQIATSYKIAQMRAQEIRNKGGFIRKSFKRAKSLDRGMGRGAESEEFKNAIKNVKAYTRVIQQENEFMRPVVLLGLFCDTAREMLVRDLPDYFGIPSGAIEITTNANDNPGIPPVNVRPIEAVINNDKHPVVILSPVGIRYVQEETDLNAMVVYLSPQNKALVKTLKAKFAPGFDRKAGFMFDEAMHFAKQHSGLFDATVNYTSDNRWLSNLKDTIAKLQKQPQWQPVPAQVDDQYEDNEDEDDDVETPLQPPTYKQQVLRQNQQERGRSRQPRISKTTDDIPQIPDAIQDILSRHGRPNVISRPYERTQSVGESLGNGYLINDEASTVSQHSQHSQRSGPRTPKKDKHDGHMDTSQSSMNSEKKPKKSILKKSQTSLAEDHSGENDEFSTSSSSSWKSGQRPQQQQYYQQQQQQQQHYQQQQQQQQQHYQQQQQQQQHYQQQQSQEQVPQQQQQQQFQYQEQLPQQQQQQPQVQRGRRGVQSQQRSQGQSPAIQIQRADPGSPQNALAQVMHQQRTAPQPVARRTQYTHPKRETPL